MMKQLLVTAAAMVLASMAMASAQENTTVYAITVCGSPYPPADVLRGMDVKPGRIMVDAEGNTVTCAEITGRAFAVLATHCVRPDGVNTAIGIETTLATDAAWARPALEDGNTLCNRVKD